MAGYVSSDVTTFLRPESTQPYVIENCAKWLVCGGKFKNFDNAKEFLINMMLYKPQIFKWYISEYHKATDFRTGYLVDDDFSKSFRSVRGPYGEDTHMGYSRKICAKN